MDSLRTQYCVFAELRGGKKLYMTDENGKRYFKAVEKAKEVMNKAARMRREPMRAGSFTIEVQDTPGEHDYDLMRYVICKRQVTDWEEVK